MSGLINNEGVLKVPPSFTNMFKKKSIKNITYEFNSKKSYVFRRNMYHEATIRFSIDDTDMSQSFYDDDMNDLVKQVEEFVKTLK